MISAALVSFLLSSGAAGTFDPHALRELSSVAQVTQARPWAEGSDPAAAEAAQVIVIEGLLRQGDGAGALREVGTFWLRFPRSILAQRVRLFQAWAELELGNIPQGVQSLADIMENVSDARAVQLARSSLRDMVKAGRLDLACAAKLMARLHDGDPLVRDLQQMRRSGEAPVFVVLPQYGEVGELGRRARQGAELELKQENQPYVFLEESSDPTETWKLVKAAVALVRPRAIVGPMMSASAAVVTAGLANALPDVPVILPTATSSGIASLDPGAWQLNFTTAAQGEALARYAWNCLDIREAAILAPEGDYGDGVANGFRNAFLARGGRIFWQQFYPSGRTDFRAQLESLRRSWQQGAHQKDTTPVIFVPAETAREVILMQRQLSGISPVWLGSSGWHTQSFLKESGGNLSGAYLVTDYAPDDRRTEWRTFSKLYKQNYKEIPDRVASLGYDAARLALNPSRLKSDSAYAGTQGEIRFDSRERQNVAVPFLRVSRTAFLVQAGDCTQKP